MENKVITEQGLEKLTEVEQEKKVCCGGWVCCGGCCFVKVCCVVVAMSTSKQYMAVTVVSLATS